MGPTCVIPLSSAAQTELSPTAPHVPHDPSTLQYGLAAFGHGFVAVVPISPLQATHVARAPAVLHTGFVPVQGSSAASHAPHTFPAPQTPPYTLSTQSASEPHSAQVCVDSMQMGKAVGHRLVAAFVVQPPQPPT
jgi:hypothetical protein